MRTSTSSPWAWFNNRGVNTRIVFALAVAALVGALVGASGIAALSRTNDAANALYEDNLKGVEVAAVMREATLDMRLMVTNL